MPVVFYIRNDSLSVMQQKYCTVNKLICMLYPSLLKNLISLITNPLYLFKFAASRHVLLTLVILQVLPLAYRTCLVLSTFTLCEK